jgi:hypothetical protein
VRSRPGAGRRRAVAIALAALLVAACGSTTSPGPTGESTSVALGIYSGRPDPTWTLTEAQAAELSRRLGHLAPAVGTPPEGGLGYRGFTIATRGSGEGDRSLVVYRGAVAAPGVGSRSYLVDPMRSLERYLLDTGRSHLTAEHVRAVEADLATP